LLFVPTRLLFHPGRLVIRVRRVATNRNCVVMETTRVATDKEPVAMVPRRLRFLQTDSGKEIQHRCITIRGFTIVPNRSPILRRSIMTTTSKVTLGEQLRTLENGAVKARRARAAAREPLPTRPDWHSHTGRSCQQRFDDALQLRRRHFGIT
jgi:hypothetical protein